MEEKQQNLKSTVDIWLDAWKDHAGALVHPLYQDYLNSLQPARGLYALAVPRNEGDLNPPTGQFRHELGAVPFVGNIRTATIFLLMINPGVNWGDYRDRANPETQSLFTMNKRQLLETCFALQPSPAKSWSTYYLQNTFGKVLSHYPAADFERVRAFLCQNLAILELVPYFSQNANLLDRLRMGRDLPTANLARSAAKELAYDEKNLIITHWENTEQRWGLIGRTVQSATRQGLGAEAKQALWRRIDLGLGR